VRDVRAIFERREYIELIKLTFDTLSFFIDQVLRQRGAYQFVKCDFKEKLFWLY